VEVCLNVRVVDPVVTQLVTQQPRPDSAEVAQEALSAPVRTAVDPHGYGIQRGDAVHDPQADPSMQSTVGARVTFAVSQVTKAGTTRRGQV
jgi:hypothetical protein